MEKAMEILEKEGLIVQGEKPMSPGPTWTMRIAHALFGCRPISYYILDTQTERAVLVGRICPVCETEYPL